MKAKYYAGMWDATGGSVKAGETPVAGFNYDEREVNDVKIASFDEFYKCMMDHNDEAFGEELKKLEAFL